MLDFYGINHDNSIAGPVEQGGLPGLVPLVFEILVLFTSFQQKKEDRTNLELLKFNLMYPNDPNQLFSILRNDYP